MQDAPSINADRLFSKIQRYFGSYKNAIVEAVQNAYRASWTDVVNGKQVSLWINHTTPQGGEHAVEFIDSGHGINDPIKMLSLAESEWAHDVEGTMDPAGMGVFALLAFSKSVTWKSKFGQLVVESQPFFNSKEYRAELKSKILPWEGDGKTHVILHGFNHGSWEVADAIRQVCANYPALTCRLNGQAIQVSAILSTALEVGRVGLTRVLYQRGHEYRTCFWHGHKIVRPALGQVKVVNRLGEFIVDNTSMVLDIRDENRITPQLPARDYVVMDERTTSFLAEAAKVFAEGLVNAAIAKAEHLSQQSKVTPDDLRELADICRPITGGHQIMLHADWKNFETLKFKEDDGATVVVKAMRRSKIRGCFDEFLVVTPTYTEDFEIGECGSFSMNEGEDDYLAANNYVHSSAYDNKVYPCIVTRDDFDADGVNVIGAYELRVVAAKDVEPLLRTEDYHAIWELVAKAEVLIDAEDNVDLAVMLHRSSDPETDLPTKFITTDFGHARSLWSSIYLGYQRHHNDGEYGPSEVETECENHWDDLQAELDGEIRLPISKYTLQSKLGIRTGVPVVFDFEKNTATVGEKVMKLAW